MTIPVSVQRICPLSDARWPRFLQRHPDASIFHTPAWAEALRRTYGYEPVVYTTAAPGEDLASGLLLCRIKSWLTGHRMVSVPFADHCQPLVDNGEDFRLLATALEKDSEREGWNYVELRPLYGFAADPEESGKFAETETFCFHKVDLRPDLDAIFRSFHKNCIQRKIQRAERVGLTYEEGRSESLLEKFYHLLLLTRRRHQLPPQPRAWFRNLMDCLENSLKIRVVSKDDQPVAGILTLTYKNSLVYKYGCSDANFHNLGGMSLLFWKAIQDGKNLGAHEFDLGRSECQNAGLIAFKEHWGAARSMLVYARFPQTVSHTVNRGWRAQIAKQIFAHLPTRLLTGAGKLLYKHIG